MSSPFTTIFTLTIPLIFAIAQADEAHARPAVPIGVDYDSPLEQGGWTLSYVYQRIEGKGLRKGKDRVDSDELTDATITQVPVEMEVDVHTVGIRYAPFERLTLLAKLPILNKRMRQRDFDDGGERYTTHSSGFGDLEIVGLVPFMEKRDETLDLHLGLRFPTGEISNKDDVPDAGGGEEKVLLPLPMQLGSRTFSILSGLTYQGYWRGLGWGFHGGATFGFGDNHRGYRLGNEMVFTGWLAHDVTDWLSGSFRLGFDRWNRLHGSSRSGPENHQVSYQSASAGKRLALGPGLSVGLPGLGEQRLSIEASWPVYQAYKGGQVEQDWSLTTGWEWVF